jgi:dynein heavy chain
VYFSISLLSIAGETLLDDPDLLNTLKTSKATSISIQESLVVTEETEKEIDLAREGYRPCSKRASILFFTLNDMSVIDPMYQFSLDAYNTLFMLSIDKSPKATRFLERIEKLNDYHTYAVYRYRSIQQFQLYRSRLIFNANFHRR